jgi:hypothetical protein
LGGPFFQEYPNSEYFSANEICIFRSALPIDARKIDFLLRLITLKGILNRARDSNNQVKKARWNRGRA